LRLRDQLPPARSKVKIIEGSANNMPDERSHIAALEILNLLTPLKETDLVLALVSGQSVLYHTGLELKQEKVFIKLTIVHFKDLIV